MEYPEITLEKDFRRHSNSWLSYAGALLVSGLLFFLIGSTRSGIDDYEQAAEAELLYHYLPPPRAETQKPLPLASRPGANFKFDLPDLEETTEQIPLDLLNINLNLNPVSETDIVLNLEGRFRPQKPNVVTRLIIYNRDEVDEKPVRIYAPSFTTSTRLRREGAFLIVLYRVSDAGRTNDIHILDTNNEEASEIAQRIIKGSRFRPAKMDGRAVNVWVQHDMVFEADTGYTPFSL